MEVRKKANPRGDIRVNHTVYRSLRRIQAELEIKTLGDVVAYLLIAAGYGKETKPALDCNRISLKGGIK